MAAWSRWIAPGRRLYSGRDVHVVGPAAGQGMPGPDLADPHRPALDHLGHRHALVALGQAGAIGDLRGAQVEGRVDGGRPNVDRVEPIGLGHFVGSAEATGVHQAGRAFEQVTVQVSQRLFQADARGPAGETRPGRQGMGMVVDEAGHDHAARRVEHHADVGHQVGMWRPGQDVGDRLALHEQRAIRDHRLAVARHDGAALDYQTRHRAPPHARRLLQPRVVARLVAVELG